MNFKVFKFLIKGIRVLQIKLCCKSSAANLYSVIYVIFVLYMCAILVCFCLVNCFSLFILVYLENRYEARITLSLIK